MFAKTIPAPVMAVEKTMAEKSLQFVILASVVSILPAVIHTQWITGPLVNAALIIATILLGPITGLVFALIPSPIALVSGTLPAVLAPMVPFIMLGNAALVMVVHALHSRHFRLAVAVGAVAKCTLLLMASMLFVASLLPAKMLGTIIGMMGFPQLITALIGGVIAYTVIHMLEVRHILLNK